MSNLDLEKQQNILERAQKLVATNNSLFSTQRASYLQQYQLIRDETTDSFRDQEEKELQNSIALSIQKCSEIQEQIENTRKEIQSFLEKNKKISRLQYEEMILRSQIDHTEVSPFNTTEITSPNHLVSLLEYEQELRETVQQHKQLIVKLHKQKFNLNEEIKHQEEILEERKVINNALEERITQPSSKKKQQSKVSQLAVEINQISKENDELMTDLKKFLNKVYPLNEALESDMEEDEQGNPQYKYESLKKILQDLISRMESHPDDPYVPITNRYWPAYMELLLRSGIAEKHPKDNKLLKIVSFNK